MSVSRNHCRVDIQLYLDIPDKVLTQIEKPGWKRNAIDTAHILIQQAETPVKALKALMKYKYDIRYKVSGGNVQLARDVHLIGEPRP